jgi:hypothetical protein
MLEAKTATLVNALVARVVPELAYVDMVRFQDTTEGQGVLELVGTLTIYFVVGLLGCAVLDLVLTRNVTRALGACCGGPCWKPSATKKTSWYLLHALFNLCIVVLSWDEAVYCFLHPSDMWDGWFGSRRASLMGAILIGAFHVHHLILFDFSKEDLVHHLINAGLVVLIGVFCPWGYSTALSNMAMCGLPGAVNYFALWLHKLGRCSRMRMKNITRWTNIVIRLPVQLLSVLGWVIAVSNGKCPVDIVSVYFPLMVVGVVAHTANAIYYADQAVGTYHVNEHQARAERTAQKEARGKEKHS